MPVYEYRCDRCGGTSAVLVRRASVAEAPVCDRCGQRMPRTVSGFAFHRSLRSKVEQLDPKYDRMIDAANPDLASDNLIRRWGLEKPLTGKRKKAAKKGMEKPES